MQVAVTGGSGLIGRQTIDELGSRGHSTRNLDLQRPDMRRGRYMKADLTDFGQVVGCLHGCDAIIHLGAALGPKVASPSVVYSNNVNATYHVLLAAAELGINKIVIASSINAIGMDFSIEPTYDYLPMDEKHPGRPEDCYSLSKWCNEHIADAFARRYPHMIIASMRYPATVPPEVTRERRKPNEGRYAGWRKSLWGYLDVRDAARANCMALEADWKGHEVFFIIAKENFSGIPSAELAQKHYPDLPRHAEFPGIKALYDCSKAKKFFGWEPQYSWVGRREGDEPADGANCHV